MDFLAYLLNPFGIFALLFLICLYIYLKIIYSYWDRKGIPSPKTTWFLGSYGTRWDEPQGYIELEWYRKYGKLFGIYEGLTPVLMVSEPKLIKNILIRDFNQLPNQRRWQFGDPLIDHMIVTLEDDEWRRVKSVIAPIFSIAKIKKLVPKINKCVNVLQRNLKEASKNGNPVEYTQYFNAFVVDSIARCAYNMVINSHDDPKNPFVNHICNLFLEPIPWRSLLLVTFPRISELLKISIIDTQCTAFLHKTVLELLEERKNHTEEKYDDFLQWILDSSNSSENILQNNVFNNTNNQKLSQDEIISQCLVLFVVGFVTTAATINFVIYSLASNPDCQEKLVKELQEKLNGKEELEYEDIQNLHYLEAVISETLRYYSPVSKVIRMGHEDYHLEGTDIVVPKNTMIGIPIYAIHHDEEWFPNPKKFDPERFLPENKNLIHPYTFMPFGFGQRNCLGSKFSQMEMKLCLASTLLRFRFTLCEESKLIMDFGLGLEIHRPKEAILKIERRILKE